MQIICKWADGWWSNGCYSIKGSMQIWGRTAWEEFGEGGGGGRAGHSATPVKKCYFWHFYDLKFEPDNLRWTETIEFVMHVKLWRVVSLHIAIYLKFLNTAGLQNDIWKAHRAKNVIFLFFGLKWSLVTTKPTDFDPLGLVYICQPLGIAFKTEDTILQRERQKIFLSFMPTPVKNWRFLTFLSFKKYQCYLKSLNFLKPCWKHTFW